MTDNTKRTQGLDFLRANPGLYSFEFNNESLQLILHRKEYVRDIAIPLDMTAIFEQCTPENIARLILNDLIATQQIDKICRNNKEEGACMPHEEYTKLLEDYTFCIYQVLNHDKKRPETKEATKITLDDVAPF